MFSYALLVSTLLPSLALGQVSGAAIGFASGVTGGGDAKPVTPSTIDELVTYLTDDEPRVIMIDREFDFVGTEGMVTMDGCRPDSNTCGKAGQDALDGPNWCSSEYPTVEVTYSEAALNSIRVASHKSIVGVGKSGIIRGKGLYLTAGVSNIIIQNIHITDLNPQYIWGGDAITLVGTDMVWIDHCKFSLIGRQMIVTGYEPAGRVTISNSEFAGQTSWSASCNNDHYWTMLLLGNDDQITLVNNHFHDVSGRAPKVGSEGSIVLHAVNNLFSNNAGHNFDITEGANVLLEGNVFTAVNTPINSNPSGALYNVPQGTGADCASILGRNCVDNIITDSGEWVVGDNVKVVSLLGDGNNIAPMQAGEVEEFVLSSAGIGLLEMMKSSRDRIQ